MLREDVTPMPVAVTTESGPDSSGNYAVEMPQTQARQARSFLRRLLAPTAGLVVGTAALVGPDAVDAVRDRDLVDFRANASQADSEDHPAQLKDAQERAAYSMFKITQQGGPDTKAAEQLANQPGRGKTLNVNSYVNPDHMTVSPDGNYFTVDGKNYGLTRRSTEAGDVLVLASRVVIEERLLATDKAYYSDKKILVGGARNNAKSDRNGDGVTTPEEVMETADELAARNIKSAFSPPEYITRNSAEDLER